MYAEMPMMMMMALVLMVMVVVIMMMAVTVMMTVVMMMVMMPMDHSIVKHTGKMFTMMIMVRRLIGISWYK